VDSPLRGERVGSAGGVRVDTASPSRKRDRDAILLRDRLQLDRGGRARSRERRARNATARRRENRRERRALMNYGRRPSGRNRRDNRDHRGDKGVVTQFHRSAHTHGGKEACRHAGQRVGQQPTGRDFSAALNTLTRKDSRCARRKNAARFARPLRGMRHVRGGAHHVVSGYPLCNQRLKVESRVLNTVDPDRVTPLTNSNYQPQLPRHPEAFLELVVGRSRLRKKR